MTVAGLLPQIYLDTGSGLKPSDGSKIAFTEVGSSTPKDIYTTAAADIEHANPVIANSVGVFDQIFLIGDYDWILTDKNDIQISTGSVSELVTTASINAIEPFDTIAALKASGLAIGSTAKTLGYNTAGDGGGGTYRIVANQTVDNFTDHILANNNAALLELSTKLFVGQCGAFGSTDETSELQAFFSQLIANEYRGIMSAVEYVTTAALLVDSGNTKLTVGSPVGKATIRVDAVIDRVISLTECLSCKWESIGFNLNDNAPSALNIRTTSSTPGTVTIDNLSIDDCKQTTQTVTPQPVVVSGTYANIDITRVVVNNVSRVNTALFSAGIVVLNATGIINIKGNTVLNVLSPSGFLDADGIVVFGPADRLDRPAVKQDSKTVISGNKIINCTGRLIKLQIANFTVRDNYLEIDDIEIITNFHGIDAQIGGGVIVDNYIRLKYSVGGASASFVQLQSHDYGGLENVFSVINNTFHNDNEVTYGVQWTTGFDGLGADIATNTSVTIRGNKSNSNGTPFRIGVYLQLSMPETANSFFLDISDNETATGSGVLIDGSGPTRVAWSDATKGPVISDYTTMRVIGNTNTIPDGNADVINSGNLLPFLQNVVFSDNVYERNGISLQGFDILQAPDGNSFFYNNDGASDGIINAPTGYDRTVTVETLGKVNARLTFITSAKFAVGRLDTNVWSEYTGVLIP